MLASGRRERTELGAIEASQKILTSCKSICGGPWRKPECGSPAAEIVEFAGIKRYCQLFVQPLAVRAGIGQRSYQPDPGNAWSASLERSCSLDRQPVIGPKNRMQRTRRTEK